MTKPFPETCLPEPGPLRPVIDRNRCEGKEDCVAVCPYDVFAIRKVGDGEKAGMSTLGRLKLFVHGGKQAFAVKAELCHACGSCVTACPEKAITLRRGA